MQQNDKNAPPKEGEILESETSNVGYLQTTEMIDLTNQGVVEFREGTTNNFGPRSLGNSPWNSGRHAVKAGR